MEIVKPMALDAMSEEEKKLVEAQLENILRSTFFNSAKQMQLFLEHIVKKTLLGEGSSLKQYTIGIEALSFPDNFDTDNNPNVRIMGGRVRQRLREFYQYTENQKIIIDIPKGTYVPNFGYADKQNLNTIHNKKILSSTGPNLALVSFPDQTQSDISNRLVIQTTDTLAEICSSFLLFNLSVFNPLADKSLSHSSKNNINTDYILAFYVREIPDNKYELLCRFTKVGSKQVLWSETYDLDEKSSVAKQEGIIRSITASVVDIHQGMLQLHWARNLLVNKESIKDEFKVLAYYRQYFDNFNQHTFAEAIDACEMALIRNPSDTIASVIYSDLCRKDYVYSNDQIDSALQKGIKSVEKVTHLRPDSSEGHYVFGQLLFSQGDWERAEDELKTARKLSHYNIALQFSCGYYLCLMNKWDEGMLIVEKAMATSDRNPSWYHIATSLFHYQSGRYEEALVEANRIVAPNIPHGPLARCICHAQLGNMGNANQEFIELLQRIPILEQKGEKTIYRFFGNKEIAEKVCTGIELVTES